MSVEHFVLDTEQRRLEVALMRAAAELYDYQMEVSAGRNPRNSPGEPFPGVRVRQATEALADWHGSITHLLTDLDQEQSYAPAPIVSVWVTRTMDDIRTGDRIRFRGTEAVVESAFRNGWHVHPASRYEVIPLEHGDVAVRLMGREKVFVLKPDLEVDICLTEDEVAALDAMGWENRVCVITQLTSGLLSVD